MTPHPSFLLLMQQLEAGDPRAAARVYQRYSWRLIALARRELFARFRARVDADDVVQSVFRTFFRRAAGHEFDLEGEEALWALLAEITLRKCGYWNRHFGTQKRGGKAPTAPLGALPAGREPADEREPSPQDAVVLIELLERLLAGLGEQERLICEMRLQGYEVEEIAGRLGCSLATVFRKLARLRSRLRRLLPEGD